jgi:anthranilate phosphoribosyltransferase
MNVLGPLANPAGAGRQVVGVSEPARLPLLAGALAALGSVHAMVVHGEPGMDEISPMGTTAVLEVRDGTLHEWTIEPEAFDLPRAAATELAGGSPAENASVIEQVLRGERRDGARSAVLLNTAAALYVAGQCATFGEGMGHAAEALARGAGIAALDRLRAATDAAA